MGRAGATCRRDCYAADTLRVGTGQGYRDATCRIRAAGMVGFTIALLFNMLMCILHVMRFSKIVAVFCCV